MQLLIKDRGSTTHVVYEVCRLKTSNSKNLPFARHTAAERCEMGTSLNLKVFVGFHENSFIESFKLNPHLLCLGLLQRSNHLAR